MKVKKAVEVAAGKLCGDILTNEALVKSAVIAPILRTLDWDDSNPKEVIPEFPAGDGKVDFALCGAKGPAVFIEAKRLGGADIKAEEQLFNYAVNRGVPFLILTDGAVWNFYLSMAAGVPAERRFFRAELRRAENIDKYADFFARFFQKSAVLSGRARQAAEKMHEDNVSRSQARETIPEVWRGLLKEPDEILRDLLAEAVEGVCGTKPDLDDVDEFLDGQTSAAVSPERPRAKSRSAKQPPLRTQIAGFVYKGKRCECSSGRTTLSEILKMFQRENSAFMTSLASRTARPKRRLVAQTREELYNRAEMVHFSFDLENGWWLGTHLSSNDVRRYVRVACETAKARFGKDLTLIEK